MENNCDEENKSKDSDSKDLNDDLEDGEIETDDDEPIITSIEPATKNDKTKNVLKPSQTEIPIVDLVSEKYPSKSQENAITKKSNKSYNNSGSGIADDDFAGNIENAIAAALKKEGIEPPVPKSVKREDSKTNDDQSSLNKGKNKRRRKRSDSEKEKNKKRAKQNEEQILNDIDDYEMLCIRGGSPPPTSSNRVPLSLNDLTQPSSTPGYYSSDDSYSSLDSYETELRKSYEEKRQHRRSKDRRQRKSGRAGVSSTTGSEKKWNRNESDGICIHYLRGNCPNVNL